MMTSKLDPKSYEEGRQAFDKGATFLSIFQRIESAMEATTDVNDSTSVAAISYALGFADGLLRALRGHRECP